MHLTDFNSQASPTTLTGQDISVTSLPQFPSNPLPWTLPLLFPPITKWPILASSNSGLTSSLSHLHNHKSGFNFSVTSSYCQQDGSIRPSSFYLSVFSDVEIWGLLSAGNSLFPKAFLLKFWNSPSTSSSFYPIWSKNVAVVVSKGQKTYLVDTHRTLITVMVFKTGQSKVSHFEELEHLAETKDTWRVLALQDPTWIMALST